MLLLMLKLLLLLFLRMHGRTKQRYDAGHGRATLPVLTPLVADLVCDACLPLSRRLPQSFVRDSAAFRATSLRSALASSVIGGGWSRDVIQCRQTDIHGCGSKKRAFDGTRLTQGDSRCCSDRR